jgi:hypothetical protein
VGIRFARDTLKDLARRPLRLEAEQQLDAIRRRDEEHEAKLLTKHDWFIEPFPKLSRNQFAARDQQRCS